MYEPALRDCMPWSLFNRSAAISCPRQSLCGTCPLSLLHRLLPVASENQARTLIIQMIVRLQGTGWWKLWTGAFFTFQSPKSLLQNDP